MQRWHLTAGLGVLAVVGAVLAPRLHALVTSPAPAPSEPTPLVQVDPVPEPVLLPVRTDPVPLPPEPAIRQGHLVVDAGLDRTAVLSGRREERFLTITVSAPADMGHAFRRPVDVAVVMDVSGSMSSRGKMDYAKQAAKVLAGSMRNGDTYSLITFSDDAHTVIPAGPVANVAAIHGAIDRIHEGGSTNLYAGLTEGGRQARHALNGENVGRVIVLSDGKANVGRTDTGSLSRMVADLSSEGISVSTVGLGLDFDEDRMTALADVGGGSYDFVDNPRQLQEVFADELERTASVVARRTRLEVKLPPGVEGLEVLGWNADRTAEGWSIGIGDVHAGESRKIVARVRVTGEVAGTLDVADVTAGYLDLVDDRPARSLASASVQVTHDTRLVDSSWDKHKAVAARRAWGNVQLERASRAYQRGDVARAQALARESQKTLQDASVDFDDESLAAEAMDAGSLSGAFGDAAPASAAGKRNIKQAKEWSYERAR